jgi:tetratricopeptide (TPR) repeat protein
VTRAAFVLVALAIALPARADDDTADAHIERARSLHARGDFVNARVELLAAYKLDERPALLFALGQVEFNLKHYRAAIDYYQRFTATNPSSEQAALAEQAIGAARMELARPPPVQPKPRPKPVPPRREFDALDSGLAIGGGVLLAGGSIAFYEMLHLSNDRSGKLGDYDHRIADAKTARIAGIACAAAGGLGLVVALARWRFHLVSAKIEVSASPSGAGVTMERRW